MIADILTIIWKEFKEVVLNHQKGQRGLIGLFVIIGLIGIYMPLVSGTAWLISPVNALVWSWMPIFITISLVADAFAGERERHTLESLLATRLPDQAILFGKIGAAVLYGWGTSLVSLLLGAVTVNLTHPGNGLLFYSADIFFGGLLLVFLISLLVSSLGVMVSLRSATVRQAYQRVSLSMMALWLLPTILLQILPKEQTAHLEASLSAINIPQAFVAAFVILGIIDLVLLAAARKRFQRSQLILGLE